MTLIERAERASSREEAVAVFVEASDLLGSAAPDIFHRWAGLAQGMPDNRQSLGCLLLAAMALIEADEIDIIFHSWVGLTGEKFVRVGVHLGEKIFNTGLCAYRCTALLSAILKASER